MGKNKLAYSQLTDKVYWIDGKGGRHECTQNFVQLVLLWLHEGGGIINEGEKIGRDLIGQKGIADWTITLERVKPSIETTSTPQ